MKAKKVVTIGGVTAAGGGMTLPIGRLSDSRWAGRVIGDHYRPIGPARGMCGAAERVSSDGRADRWHAIKALGLHRFWQTMLLRRGKLH
jgi:hypothetical protein